MKVGTLHHPKLGRLASVLDLPKYAAAGVLSSLWHFAAEVADEGDVGRFTNEDIAQYIGWDRDPAELIDALVVTRWLDPSEEKEKRLCVHDWFDHCPQYIKERMKKRRQRSAKAATREERRRTTTDYGSRGGVSPDVPDCPGTVPGLSPSCPDLSDLVPSLPNPTQPIPTNSNPTTSNPTTWTRKEVEEVEGELVKRGVSQAAIAIEGAKDRGVPPATVRELIREFDSASGQWAAGALYGRVNGRLASWPPPAADHRARERREERERAVAGLHEKHNAQRAAAARDKARIDALVEHWETEAESLSDEDAIGLVQTQLGVSANAMRLAKGNLRRQLIAEALEKSASNQIQPNGGS